MQRIKRAVKSRLPQSREGWLVSIGWHISAIFLFLTLWTFPTFPELSFLTLFIALYVHVVVNRRLAERKLKAHHLQESKNREAAVKTLRNDLTTHLDTTTHALRNDLSAADLRMSKENHTSASAIAYLNQQIQPKTPIWFSRGWAASPELLATIYELIITRKPKYVLDLGSGLTTLIAGYAVQENGTGQVEAWEHLENYAHETSNLVKQHNLEKWARVTTNSLKDTSMGNRTYEWFSQRPEKGLKIDLLIVDSPPGSVGSHARYPALQILSPWLADDIVVILDDVDRSDEKETVEKWLAESGPLTVDLRGESSKSQFAILTRPMATS